MIRHWADKACTSQPDSFNSSFHDWMVIGAYAGFRKSEWLQDSSEFKKTKDFLRNIDGTVKAFVRSDFEFRDKHHRRIYPDVRGNILDAHQVSICWRFQKNSDNGQKILFTRNIEEQWMCAVAAATRVYERSVRLRMADDVPLAIYAKKGIPTFMTQVEVEVEMQACAKKLYNLTTQEDIARYTAHSVRVGACVALHSTGASIMTIKFRLRWRSEKFVSYLRHVNQLADSHNISMNAVNLYGA